MRAQHIGLPVAKDIDLSGDVFWLTGPRSLIEFGRFSPASEMSKDQISWASKVAARYPMPVVVYKYALCLSLNGMEQQARTELEKMRVLHGEKMYARHLELFNDQLDVASLKN